LKKIIPILASYSNISTVFEYNVIFNSLLKEYHIEINSLIKTDEERINQNIFSLCMHEMLAKANKNYFHNEKFYNTLENSFLINKILTNYHNLFMDIFPKSNLLVINHNDVHRLNIMKNISNGELMILDHEYAGLNLIGVDIVNYLIESNFDYTKKEYPFYTFNDEVSLDEYFMIYQQYLDKFKEVHDETIKNKFDRLYSFRYFLRLICINSLFWFLWAVIYFDEKKISSKSSFDYYGYALKRILIFQKAYNELKHRKSTH